jgi:integrase
MTDDDLEDMAAMLADPAVMEFYPRPTSDFAQNEHGWFANAVQRCMAADPDVPRVTPHDLRHTAAYRAVVPEPT